KREGWGTRSLVAGDRVLTHTLQPPKECRLANPQLSGSRMTYAISDLGDARNTFAPESEDFPRGQQQPDFACGQAEKESLPTAYEVMNPQ
ncbi:MAG: hypothetical protein WA510_09845, partial [Acidobacteriaceae bacterium]